MVYKSAGDSCGVEEIFINPVDPFDHVILSKKVVKWLMRCLR